MAIQSRFKCPACGFAVFNRRLSTCESCSAALPPEFGFTAKQLSYIETEHQRNERVRAELARETKDKDAARSRRGGADGVGTEILGGLLDGLAGDD